MGKEEILDYVMNSPENTNRAVLSSMLDSMGGGSVEPLVVNINNNIMDKTWQEIYDVFPNVYVFTTVDDTITKQLILRIVNNSTGYFLDITNFSTGRPDIYWTADSGGYPILD